MVYEEQGGEVLLDRRQEYMPTRFGVAPMMISDIEPFKDVSTNQVFSSRRQWNEHLRASGRQEMGLSDITPEKMAQKKYIPMPDARKDIVEALEKVKAKNGGAGRKRKRG